MPLPIWVTRSESLAWLKDISEHGGEFLAAFMQPEHCGMHPSGETLIILIASVEQR